MQQFNQVIEKFEQDGTIDKLVKKWVAAEDAGKTLPAQDWDAPNGTLKFATSGVLEPYSYVGEGGEALGYDVELALLIARELGYHLEVSTIPMDAIFASVASGKVDFGGTLTNTPERAQTVDFSHEVMPSTVSVIVKAQGSQQGTTLEYTTLAALEGKKIGVLNGSISDQLVQKHMPGEHDIKVYNSPSDMIAALKSRKVEAIVVDAPVGELAAHRNSDLGLVPEPLVEDSYGFFFSKGNPLVQKFNAVIERMDSDGTLQKLKEKWTGADDAAKTVPQQDWPTPNGELTMVTDSTMEPLSYLSGSEVVGYDIEVALLICKELGYGLKVQSQNFNAVLSSVESGKADFGGGAVSITPERAKQVDFTSPNYRSAARALVRVANNEQGGASGFLAGVADSFRKTFIEDNRWQLILSGLGITVLISVSSGVLGALLGFVTVLARRRGKTWAVKLVNAFQTLMGGLPLVVVLMVLYYVVFGSLNIPGVLVAILAFTLAFGSTAGTTMWTAISGIDIIQEETGLALGYSPNEVFRKIIFPQAAQQFLPQLMGQFVSLVKDTAIVGYIAVQDLTRASDLIRARTMDAFFPLIATALIYFVICRVLAWALAKLAARFETSNRPREIEGVTE